MPLRQFAWRHRSVVVAVLALMACDDQRRRSSGTTPIAQTHVATADTAAAVFPFEVDRSADVDPAGRVEPHYPESLREAGIEGSVTLRFVVDTSGRAEMNTVRAVRSDHRYFEEAARKALARTHYLPAEKGGHKVRQWMQQEFSFALNQ